MSKTLHSVIFKAFHKNITVCTYVTADEVWFTTGGGFAIALHPDEQFFNLGLTKPITNEEAIKLFEYRHRAFVSVEPTEEYFFDERAKKDYRLLACRGLDVWADSRYLAHFPATKYEYLTEGEQAPIFCFCKRTDEIKGLILPYSGGYQKCTIM